MDFSTTFLTYIRRQLLSYTQCSYPVNFNTAISTFEYHVPYINQYHTNTALRLSKHKHKELCQRTQALSSFELMYIYVDHGLLRV
jgi:hypothetical protein